MKPDADHACRLINTYQFNVSAIRLHQTTQDIHHFSDPTCQGIQLLVFGHSSFTPFSK
jgi:hypothetical protein